MYVHYVFLPLTTSSFVQPLLWPPHSLGMGMKSLSLYHQSFPERVINTSTHSPLPPPPITAHCHTSTTDNDNTHQRCRRPRCRSYNTPRQQLHRRAAGEHAPHPTTNVPRRPARRPSIASPDGCAPPRQHRAFCPRTSRQTFSLARRPCRGASFSCRHDGPPPPPRRAGARSRRTSCRHRLRRPSVCAPSTLWTMG